MTCPSSCSRPALPLRPPRQWYQAPVIQCLSTATTRATSFVVNSIQLSLQYLHPPPPSTVHAPTLAPTKLAALPMLLRSHLSFCVFLLPSPHPRRPGISINSSAGAIAGACVTAPTMATASASVDSCPSLRWRWFRKPYHYCHDFHPDVGR